ncbi:MAG: F0F1 ATP synthase subunit beta, partial [Synechococcaceae cyanobacterium]|nr:F0F1 ATP synthase subunit beta [Synechococcaceae cyanobacterium]
MRESVVDVRFPERLPEVLHRLEAGDDGAVVLEVIAHLSADAVRSIALRPTSGLHRGAPVRDRGHPLE